MKCIGVGNDDKLFVEMTKDEWGQLRGYDSRHSYESGVGSTTYLGKEGTIEPVLIQQIRWMRSFDDSVNTEVKKLTDIANCLKSMSKGLGATFKENKVPPTASEMDKAIFSDVGGNRRIMRPPRLAFDLDLSIDPLESFDLYPCPNAAIETRHKEYAEELERSTVIGGGN